MQVHVSRRHFPREKAAKVAGVRSRFSLVGSLGLGLTPHGLDGLVKRDAVNSVSGHGELGSCCFWKTTVDESATSTLGGEQRDLKMQTHRRQPLLRRASFARCKGSERGPRLDRTSSPKSAQSATENVARSATSLKCRWRKGATYSDFCSL